MARFRDLKERLRGILSAPDWRARLAELDDVPARQLPGALFSLLLDRDELVRWRDVEAFGRSIARLAEGKGEGEGMEAARIVMRQCLWRMNEESGGLGWGVPEAMGETLARHARLAGEFHRVLASYVREEVRGEGNYLEHPGLRRGVYWALGRLAEARPELLAAEQGTLVAGLEDEDAGNAALAARVLGVMRATAARDAVAALGERLKGSPVEVAVFADGELGREKAADIVQQALKRLDSQAEADK